MGKDLGIVRRKMMATVRAQRILVIARGFLGESARQPSYYILVATLLGFALAAWAAFSQPLGLGSGSVLLLETAIGSVTLLGLLILLTIGTNVFHEEIRKRTIVTLLSKPLDSVELVLGKFLGIAILLVPAFGLASLAFTLGLQAMDADFPFTTLCAGLVLAYLQVLILAAVGLALSVHLPLAATAAVVLMFFAAGNLLPFLENELAGSGALATATVKGFSVLLPDLNLFDLTRAASLGIPVPISYLAMSILYALLYGGAALLIAIWLLDRREVY